MLKPPDNSQSVNSSSVSSPSVSSPSVSAPSVSSINTIREQYFGDTTRWQSWLDVELALAQSQGDIGMIPQLAADEITRHADIHQFDQTALRQQMSQTMAPVFALSRALADAVGKNGDYVHWGATTQNIIDTGRLLVLRRFHERLMNGLADALNTLGGMAEEHADLIMVGRTNRQPALPITYGFKIAGWIDELLRVAEQLREAEKRLFRLSFGGAIGGFHSFGEQGAELANRLGEKLKLPPTQVPNRTNNDPLIEYITKLAFLGRAIARVADELYLLMSADIGEIQEKQGHNVVGSSTMPQKVNPKHVVDLRARANLLCARAMTAVTLPSPTHEGDAAANRELSLLLQEVCPEALFLIEEFARKLPLFEPNKTRMQQNFEQVKDYIAMETLMMQLAKRIGRTAAHDLIHRLVQEAGELARPLRTVLLEDPDLKLHMIEGELLDLLAGAPNTGRCEQIARRLAISTRPRSVVQQADLSR